MTMDHEVVEEGCKNCSALRNEIEKRKIQMENSNAQQLAGFLTLKQKIIGTDKLIREYQASKVERDILTRKNEEFVHLIDQLHRDLSIRNQEYSQLCANSELLKKANSEYEIKIKQLCDEAQKWKFQAEAGQNFTSQLVEKVKILEKYEEEAKHSATVSRDREKIESKLQVLKGQLKDARETATKSKKELTKMQKDYAQLMKHSKQWGSLAESQGKLNATQKRFFLKLCNKEDKESIEDLDPDTREASEIDEQSKLLEHLLDDGNGSESMTTPMNTLQNDMVMSGGNLSSPSKGKGKSPDNSLFIRQTEQTPIKAQRRRRQDSGTSSKKSSPNKTSPETRMTRARTRTASQNSISLSSDADNALESEKENGKRTGPRTRSRSVKKTQLPGPKSPKFFDTPDPKSITQPNLPESVDDMPCRSLVSMETVLMAEPTVVQGHFRNKDLRGSLSSSESEAELTDPLNLFENNRTFAKVTTSSTTESIVGVKPLTNLFEPDVSDDTSKERNRKTARHMDQYVAKDQSKFQTPANPSALFDFDFDSSSDSDPDMIPVPTCKSPTVIDNGDRNVLLNTISSSTTASLDIADSDHGEKSVVRELPSSPATGSEKCNTSDASRSIFAIENNLDINSPTQDSNAIQSLEEKMSEYPQLEVAVPVSISLDEERNIVRPEKSDIQDLTSNHCTIASTDVSGKPCEKAIVVESNRDQNLLIASEKNLEESAAMKMGISSKELDDANSVLPSDTTKNDEKLPARKPQEHLASGTEKPDINNVSSSIFALDMDLDANSPQPDPVLTNPISNEETKSELSNAEIILQTASTVSDEEPVTVVQESVQDSNTHVCGSVPAVEANQELRNELMEVETNVESELRSADGENLGESSGEKIDVLFKNHETEIFEQVGEAKESENKAVTKKSQEESESETGESNITNVPRNIFGLDGNLDVSSSEPSSDVAQSIDEAKSELSCTEILQPSAVTLDEEPSTVREIVNIQDSLTNVEANQDFPSEGQEMEAERGSELLVVTEEISEEQGCMEVGSLSKRYEEPKSPQVIESTYREEKSITRKSPQVPTSDTADSDSIFTLDIDVDISSSNPDSDVKKPNEETQSKSLNVEVAAQAPVPLDEEPSTAARGSVTVQDSKSQCIEESKSELLNMEAVLVAPTSLDAVHSNSVLESVTHQDANIDRSCTADSSVGADKELHNEVPAKGIDEESIILPVCSEGNLEESLNAKMDIIAVMHKEQIAEQIDGLTESKSDPVTVESPKSPASGTDEPDTNVHNNIFVLHADLAISSSESESDATNPPEEKRSSHSNKEVIHQPPFCVEQTPSTDIAKTVDIQVTDSHHSCSTVSNVEAKKNVTSQLEKMEGLTERSANIRTIFEESPFMKIDIPSENIFTSTEAVEKPITKTLQQDTSSGTGESEISNARCSISAFDVDIDVSSSETKSKSANAEDSIQVPSSIDEEPSTTVPEKKIIEKSILLDCGAISIIGEDQGQNTELSLAEDIREVNEEVFATVITQKTPVSCADVPTREKGTDGGFDNEAQATPNVINDPKLSAFHAIPAKQTTVSSSPLSNRMLPGEVLSSNRLALTEDNREAAPSLQLDRIKPTDIHSPGRFPVADMRDGNPAKKDSHLSPVPRQGSIQESLLPPRISNDVLESATVPQNPQILKAVRTSAFKVPRIPDTPIKAPDVFPANVTETCPRSRGPTQAVKRTAVDDEVAVILKQIRTDIIDIPATVSPLPKSPEPQPAVKIEEPKSRFPILPRCAFNWTRKKLPLGDQLTERFGSYLHPGVKARVRFRRVSRRLLDIRSPDILCNYFQGVTNFAEAERRPKPIVKLVQISENVTDLIGYENDATEQTQKSVLSSHDPNNLPEKRLPASFLTMEVEKVTQPNPTSSAKMKRNVQALVRRPKTTTPALFGSSSSESESDSDVVPRAIEEQLLKSSTVRNLNETETRMVPSKKNKQTLSAVTTSRAQAMAQLVEPIVPLGRGNRPALPPIKPSEGQREADSMFSQNRLALGLGRGAKTSQHTIAPCSDALLSATIKSKTVTRVVAPSKPIFKGPHVPSEPVLPNPILPDISPVQEENPARKRVSHAFKRGVESDPVVSTVSPSPKRGRIVNEGIPTVSSQATQSKAPTETRFAEVSVSARTGQNSKNTLTIKPQEMVKLGLRTPTSSGKEKSQQGVVQRKHLERIKETVTEEANSETNTDSENEVPMEVNSSISEKSIVPENAKNGHQLLENSGVMNVDGRSTSFEAEESPRSPDKDEGSRPPEVEDMPDAEESPRSPEIEERHQLPDEEESPRSPDVEESPRSPDGEVSQKTRDVEDSSKSREDQPLQSFDTNGRLESIVEIPLASSSQLEEHQPTAFELVLKELLEESPHVNQKAGKLKKDINLCVNRVFKNPDVTEESWNSLIERAMRFDSKSHPFIFIRKLVATVIKGWDSPMDLSKTPPAPPMAAVHQRCVMILKELDEANSKLTAEPSDNLHVYSNLFLSECSAVMFQQDSSLTLEEMCSLARAYTAVCRSRSTLARARTFLFDCVYFLPPRSYALTYTVLSVWADVLRHISFPLGPSCIDQAIAYLLLYNCKVKAVPGIAGKVLQARSFLQNTYGYKNVTSRTIDDLTSYLMTRFKETNSADEASSLSWSFALLTRWEGIDFAIQVIEKQLWPFLQRWSSGEGTNIGAAAVIVAIGMLGKTVPSSKRAGVQKILNAMKILLQSNDVIPSIHEAAIEAVVLLGEEEDPKSVIEVVKTWKLVNTNLSYHLRQVLKAFLRRHSSLCVP
ncbi:hypothetical protein GHT06_017439 [Daphnia sinensis]|uniref:Uncharacterized protein n=1 Tax=Daphnia sinensis TaxID=1820382 RepID=A0AAD5PRW0_9CRUS|nr:hypothetical protein GHT06_017439 [Daphnia sinensis]